MSSSLHDASNGGKHMSLEEIDNKLFIKVKKRKIVNNSVSIDASDMKRPPLDAPCYDDSNKLRFILLQLLDAEILRF